MLAGASKAGMILLIVKVGFAVVGILRPEKHEHKKADASQQQELPPAAHAKVMKPAGSYGKAGQEQQQHGNIGDTLRQRQAQYNASQNLEQKEPPEFGQFGSS